MKILTNHGTRLLFFLWLVPAMLFAQENIDTIQISGIDSIPKSIDTVSMESTSINKSEKRKPFSFITSVPRDIVQLVKTPFGKKSIKPVIITIGITALLLPPDQAIVDETQKFSDRISMDRRIRFHEMVTISGRSIGLRLPKNLNTAFYQLGESTPTLLLAGGFFLHGAIKHNRRSLKTAGDITEGFLVSGIVVQILKRISGRQQPVAADVHGGRWRPFPSLRKYNDNFSQYGAYPSGHLATMMSVVTVVAENYPEKKWIRPVGYSLIALTGFSMINNGAHWISDYPLGIAIGYLAGKIASNRKQTKKSR